MDAPHGRWQSAYKRIDKNYTRMLRAYKTTTVRSPSHHLTNCLRHVRYCWRFKDELTSKVLLGTPIDGSASVGWPAKTYIHQLCADTWCSLEDRLGAMDDDVWRCVRVCVCVCVCVCLREREREGVRERERGLRCQRDWIMMMMMKYLFLSGTSYSSKNHHHHHYHLLKNWEKRTLHHT